MREAMSDLELELERELERQGCEEVHLATDEGKKRKRVGDPLVAPPTAKRGATSKTPPGAAHPRRVYLSDLSEELLLRVMLNLSAKDLACCARVCRALRLASSEDLLWKRLHDLRWPDPCCRSSGGHDEVSRFGKPKAWRKIYFDRAMADLRRSQNGCDDFMSGHIKQMHLHLLEHAPDGNDDARVDDLVSGGGQHCNYQHGRGFGFAGRRGGRDKNALGGGPLDQGRAGRRRSTMSELIRRYRTEGAGVGGGGRAGHHDGCKGEGGCELVEVDGGSGDVYICRGCGLVHVCGRECDRFVVDSGSGEMICTQTGRVLGSGATAEENEVDADGEDGGGCFGKGRLGRAYEQGYYGQPNDEDAVMYG